MDDKPTFAPESVKTAKNYVKAALDAAMAGQPVATASTHLRLLREVLSPDRQSHAPATQIRRSATRDSLDLRARSLVD